MRHPESSRSWKLGLRAGDWVEVRSAAEILATLDDRGRLDGLPFMPEMLQYCGRRFRVAKSAHKTCDTVAGCRSRWMANAVHLAELRCDGEAHGGCQAGCLIFWKEAWLERAPRPGRRHRAAANVPRPSRPDPHEAARPSVPETLARGTRAHDAGDPGGEERYTCQATELQRASTPLRWWDPRQYVKDLLSGNVRLDRFFVFLALGAYNRVMYLNWRGRPFRYPNIRGRAGETTPTATVNLKPGELVQVRSKDEIMATINTDQRNRGLFFDVEMLPFCGKRYRVLRQVDKIIDERTGAMIHLPGVCLILDGVTCGGLLSRGRLFCPRGIYPYWHEIWLKRVEPAERGTKTEAEMPGAAR